MASLSATSTLRISPTTTPVGWELSSATSMEPLCTTVVFHGQAACPPRKVSFERLQQVWNGPGNCTLQTSFSRQTAFQHAPVFTATN
ncbi:hypothetical protein LINGRAHAP2_LOCUS34798 [Linum grandiflorum]